jgi:predicted nucleic acid-binding protein
MIELWDTSALIAAVRDPEVAKDLGQALGDDEVAITEPVLLEYLNGARNLTEYDRFETRLRAARLLETTPADWKRALEVHRRLAASGAGHQRSVSLVDLIVAAVAEHARCAIVHFDDDYERIAALTRQPTRPLARSGGPAT